MLGTIAASVRLPSNKALQCDGPASGGSAPELGR